MTGTIAAVAGPLLLIAAFVALARREDVRLTRRARRFRQLELEGIEAIPAATDPYPEAAAVNGAFLREPDGHAADTERIMREELGRLRGRTSQAHAARSRTRSLRRGRGAACLL